MISIDSWALKKPWWNFGHFTGHHRMHRELAHPLHLTGHNSLWSSHWGHTETSIKPQNLSVCWSLNIRKSIFWGNHWNHQDPTSHDCFVAENIPHATKRKEKQLTSNLFCNPHSGQVKKKNTSESPPLAKVAGFGLPAAMAVMAAKGAASGATKA